MKRSNFWLLTGVAFFSLLAMSFVNDIPGKSHVSVVTRQEPEKNRLFRYQCIDTMKVSRDKARLLPRDLQEKTIIANQVQTIASLGASCIAIGTPYDAEFLPYMKQWVTEARKAGLSVWFRGNFSSWEGWFDYPKSDSLSDHSKRIAAFIRNNPDLFADGDIFSPIVEPENGGPFAPVDSEKKNILMRGFIAEEQRAAGAAFRDIDKDVNTSWISFSGGVARSVLDTETITALNQTVTLDHYVKDPKEMAEYLDDFHSRYNARLVLGEFGAPIPDLNGKMSDKKQAAFVDSLFQVMVARRSFIDGVNYWTLTESSTALMGEDSLPRPVVNTIKKYYLPATVHIEVLDRRGEPLAHIPLSLDGQLRIETTDANGWAVLIVPQGLHRLKLTHPDGTVLIAEFTAHGNEGLTVTAQFIPEIRLFLPLLNFLQSFRAYLVIPR